MLDIIGPILGATGGIILGVLFFLAKKKTESKREEQRTEITTLLASLKSPAVSNAPRLRALESAVKMVLDTHRENPQDKGYCQECDESFPCETVTLIKSTLRGTKK